PRQPKGTRRSEHTAVPRYPCTAVCVYPAENEQRYLIRTAGKRRRSIFDSDGLQLVRFTAQEPSKNRTSRSVVPAPAGVVRALRHGRPLSYRRPRTRRGGPLGRSALWRDTPSSPHPRGWSESAVPPSPFSVVVPAPAGGPVPERVTPDFTASSPHPRGWSDQTRAS